MTEIRFSCLRGVCQTPAYAAHAKGFLAEEGITSQLNVEPTAWMVPARLASGDTQFAVIPWTRVAASAGSEAPLVLLCGSGYEEAAIVIRKGLEEARGNYKIVARLFNMDQRDYKRFLNFLRKHDCQVPFREYR